MIAVILGAEEPKKRFQDAQTLLSYGFGISDIYVDENDQPLPLYAVENGVKDLVSLEYEKEFRYLDVTGKRLDQIEKQLHVEEPLQAPLEKGMPVGLAVYTLDGLEIGSVNIVSGEDIAKAVYKDYLLRSFEHFLLGESVVQ